MSPQPGERIAVLVAEDEPDTQILLEFQLGLEDDIEVLAIVDDGVEAVEFCRSRLPDVVVMDLLMPRMNGLDAIAVLREEHPDLGVVALTAVAGELVRSQTTDLGVPLVLKSGDASQLLAAVRRAAGGVTDGA